MLSRLALVAASGLMLAVGQARAAEITDWLQKRLTVAEAEAAHMVRNDWLGPDPVPFGFVNYKWRALLAEMRDGDELWAFSSASDSWRQLGGRAGIALIRHGEVVRSIVTTMN